MKAMIPHHSSAIMTSSNVDFKDPEAKKKLKILLPLKKGNQTNERYDYSFRK
jgi:hypothetical protein